MANMSLPLKNEFTNKKYSSCISQPMWKQALEEGTPGEALSSGLKNKKGTNDMQRECRNSSLIFLSLFSHLPPPTPKEPCDGSSSDWHKESLASKHEGKGDLLYIQWAYGYKRDVPTLSLFFSISSCHLAPDTDTVTEVHWRASWVKPHLSSQKTKMRSPTDWQHWEGHGEERIGLSDSIKSFVSLWDQLWAHMCGIDSIHHVEDLEIWINRPNLNIGPIQITLQRPWKLNWQPTKGRLELTAWT